MAYVEPLGQFWIVAERDPEDEESTRIPDEGALWSQPDDGTAPRDLGAFTAEKRWDVSPNGVIQIPMVSVRATLNTGHRGWGQVRSDRSGWVTIYPAKAQ